MSGLTLEELNERFVYRRDPGRDRWSVLTSKTGPLIGDCEDYALTVLWIEAGHDVAEMHRMVLRGKAALWRTHTMPGPEHTHMMLWVKGKGWIDNTHKKWSKTPHFAKEDKIGPVMFAASMILKG